MQPRVLVVVPADRLFQALLRLQHRAAALPLPAAVEAARSPSPLPRTTALARLQVCSSAASAEPPLLAVAAPQPARQAQALLPRVSCRRCCPRCCRLQAARAALALSTLLQSPARSTGQSVTCLRCCGDAVPLAAAHPPVQRLVLAAVVLYLWMAVRLQGHPACPRPTQSTPRLRCTWTAQLPLRITSSSIMPLASLPATAAVMQPQQRLLLRRRRKRRPKRRLRRQGQQRELRRRRKLQLLLPRRKLQLPLKPKRKPLPPPQLLLQRQLQCLPRPLQRLRSCCPTVSCWWSWTYPASTRWRRPAESSTASIRPHHDRHSRSRGGGGTGSIRTTRSGTAPTGTGLRMTPMRTTPLLLLLQALRARARTRRPWCLWARWMRMAMCSCTTSQCWAQLAMAALLLLLLLAMQQATLQLQQRARRLEWSRRRALLLRQRLRVAPACLPPTRTLQCQL